MKKILLSLIAMCIMTTAAFANSDEALAFFNRYVNAANTYSPTVTTMYSPNAKIIREVVKPNGQIVTRVTNTSRYISEMRKSQAIARIRRYKNNYSNIHVQSLGNGEYKISSLRQPSGESYKLKAYTVVKKENGEWKIVEEMMQTKVQMIINAK